MDDTITLIDTVKHSMFDEMTARISEVVDPSKIKCIISNHVEMDHSGSIPHLMEMTPEAEIITSPQGEKGLKKHFSGEWKFKTVKTGEMYSIGSRNLTFVHTPMVHWPDSMVTLCPDDKILFSNDAFGQHIAGAQRFDDESPLDIVLEEARKYFANIVLPYGRQVQKALDTLHGLELDMIAPSHGIIWRSHIEKIVEEYTKWAHNRTEKKCLIVYDTMWGSTEKIAYAVSNGFENMSIPVCMRHLQHNHISDIMTDVIDSEYICVGSPTLNNGMLPSVAAFLTYIKGLSPQNRTGLAFGSYGWGGQSPDLIKDELAESGWSMLESVKTQYIPDKSVLHDISESVEKQLTEQ
jgi:flavorubredoxin